MTTRHRSNENGIAMIIALFMMLILSVVGATLMTLAQTETDSSYNYRLMSQSRYGGESAIHSATNYLIYTYAPPSKADVDPATGIFDLTKSPVLYNGNPVVLSTVVAQSNYPDDAVKAAFAAAAQGTLDMKDASVNYGTVATLKSMRSITDWYSKTDTTIQTWEISGDGTITGGAKTALVEVASVLERQPVPVYGYAAFATFNGCKALSLQGGATTDSYDSSWALGAGGKPITENDWGNVGTNGNLTEVGNDTTVHGSLSTPRQGSGACSANNVTAESLSGGATVDKGMNRLPQTVKYPTPETITPAPPLYSQSITKNTGCPTPAAAFCSSIPDPNTANKVITYITPTPTSPDPGQTVVQLGNVTINAGATLHLQAGKYDLNSITMMAGSQIVIDSGPVVINVAGKDSSGGDLATPVTITGQGIVNTSFVSTDLQIVYGGTGEVKLAGGDNTAAVVYAPNASASITGGADLYGAIIVHDLKEAGGASIHYDRHLKTLMFTPGDFTMSAFTWKVASKQ
jgi:hypothetical protein